MSSLKALGENFLPSPWCPFGFGNITHCLPPSLHNLLYWPSVCSNFSLLIRAPSWIEGPPKPVWPHPVLIIFKDAIFKWGLIQVLEVRTSTYLLGEYSSTHNTWKGPKNNCEDHTPKTQTHNALQRLRLNPKIRESPSPPDSSKLISSACTAVDYWSYKHCLNMKHQEKGKAKREVKTRSLKGI